MNILSAIWRDLIYGVRSLLKDRGSVASALLALSLGIGATTVIFSVVDQVLLEPYPYKDQNQLVHFYIHDMKSREPYGRQWYTVPEFLDYRAQNHVFSAVMGGGSMDVLYTMGGVTFQTRGALIEPFYPAELGIQPILGRELTDFDGEPGAPQVFIMGYQMWRQKFNGDPEALGMTLTLNGVPRTLVAIMPPRFRSNAANLWIPIGITPGLTDAVRGESGDDPLFLWTTARLKPGVSMEQAAADIDVIARNEARIYPNLYPKQFKVVVSRQADPYISASLRTMIYILVGAVLMLLLIACSNVANLLLARAMAREKELAIRRALGASRERLIRQLLVESFVLAAAGAVIGCSLAYAGLQWVRTSIPQGTFPVEVVIVLNKRTLLATLGVTLLTTLLCGLVPALRATRGDLQSRLTGTGRGAGEGRGHGRLRAALVAAQAGLAVVLLSGAGLMMRTFFALEHVDLGFDPRDVLVARVVFPARQYIQAAQKELFYRQVLERLGVLPGVVSASATSAFPVEYVSKTEASIPGKIHTDTWNSALDFVSADYFKTLGMPLVRGRVFSETDVSSARTVAVINRAFAHDFLGPDDPLGRTIKFGVFDRVVGAPHDAAFEIVGVVGDALNDGIESAPAPEAFLPNTTAPGWGTQLFLLRTAVSPISLLPSVRQAIWQTDPNVALADADSGSLESILYKNDMAAPAFGLGLLAIFGTIGLTLAAIGMFSVMLHSVSLQTREIGIRMALGAQPDGVLKMVLLRGLRPVLAGVAAGFLASYGLTRLMASVIYGISAADPWTFAGSAVILVIVALLACSVPAWRATKVDPTVALRYE